VYEEVVEETVLEDSVEIPYSNEVEVEVEDVIEILDDSVPSPTIVEQPIIIEDSQMETEEVVVQEEETVVVTEPNEEPVVISYEEVDKAPEKELVKKFEENVTILKTDVEEEKKVEAVATVKPPSKPAKGFKSRRCKRFDVGPDQVAAAALVEEEKKIVLEEPKAEEEPPTVEEESKMCQGEDIPSDPFPPSDCEKDESGSSSAPNSTVLPLFDLDKPVKVKSRWRRSSELEMGNSLDSSCLSNSRAFSPPPSPGQCEQQQPPPPPPSTNNTTSESLAKLDPKMEERLKNFEPIVANEYLTQR
jgi:histone-lysine N-methyltransferase SETD2